MMMRHYLPQHALPIENAVAAQYRTEPYCYFPCLRCMSCVGLSMQASISSKGAQELSISVTKGSQRERFVGRLRAERKTGNEQHENISTEKRELLDNAKEAEPDIHKAEEKIASSGLVESLEELLGRNFGGVLWFSVLLASIAVFGGGYVYLILKYADFSDIPILRGPTGQH